MIGGVATGLTVGAEGVELLGVAAGVVGVGVGVESSSLSSPPDEKYDFNQTVEMLEGLFEG